MKSIKQPERLDRKKGDQEPAARGASSWQRLCDVQQRVRRGEYIGFAMSRKPTASVRRREFEAWLNILEAVQQVLKSRKHVAASDRAEVRKWIFAFGGSAAYKRGQLHVSDPTAEIARWIDAGWSDAVQAAAAREDFETPAAARAALKRRGLTERQVCAAGFPGWTRRTRAMFVGEREARRIFLEMLGAVAALLKARGIPNDAHEPRWWARELGCAAYYAQGKLVVKDRTKEIARWLAFGWTDATQAHLARFDFKTPARARAALKKRGLTEARVCAKGFPGWTRETRLHFAHEREVRLEMDRLDRLKTQARATTSRRRRA